jgi:toxin FitB
MNVVDSSAWLEYFAEGPNAQNFAEAIEDVASLLVPTLSIFEVFKRVLTQRGEDRALQIVAQMQQGQVIELTLPISLLAAQLSVHYRLPMAESVILATARTYRATLWSQDSDFESIEDVKYFKKATTA